MIGMAQDKAGINGTLALFGFQIVRQEILRAREATDRLLDHIEKAYRRGDSPSLEGLLDTKSAPRKKVISIAGLRAIRKAQKARWAKYKAEQPAAPVPIASPAVKTAKPKKVIWTPAMRRKAAERMRRVNAEVAARKRAATRRQAEG